MNTLLCLDMSLSCQVRILSCLRAAIDMSWQGKKHKLLEKYKLQTDNQASVGQNRWNQKLHKILQICKSPRCPWVLTTIFNEPLALLGQVKVLSCLQGSNRHDLGGCLQGNTYDMKWCNIRYQISISEEKCKIVLGDNYRAPVAERASLVRP